MGGTSSTHSSQTTTQSRYFISAPVDFFFIGGSSFIIFFGFLLFYTDARTSEIIYAGVMLSFIINWPHFSMSSYRLYHTKSNRQQYPVTAYVIPFIVVGGMLLSFVYDDLLAPYFIKLYMLWSPYHFCAQTIGITFIYAIRCGIKLNSLERRVFTIFILGIYLLSMVRAETSREGYEYYGITYPNFAVPQWLADIMEVGMWVAMAALAIAIIYWCVKNKRTFPLIVLLPAATQYLWFIQAVYMPSFQELVPMLHSLQYILIAWGIQLKEKMDINGIEPSVRYARLESSRWLAINIAGGVLLFYYLPELGELFGYTEAFSIGLVYAAIQLHHFFVDGVIWKLKNKTVSHPLMMNLGDITGANRDTNKTRQEQAT